MTIKFRVYFEQKETRIIGRNLHTWQLYVKQKTDYFIGISFET